jgi:hypothetical protein
MPSTVLSTDSGGHSVQKLSVLFIYSLLFLFFKTHQCIYPIGEMQKTEMCVEIQIMDSATQSPIMNVRIDIRGTLNDIFENILSHISIT